MTIHPASEFHPGAIGLFKLPEEVYRPAPGANISALKKMEISPRHYKDAFDHPEPPSGAQEFGTIYHSMILEPDLPPKFVVETDPNPNRRAKEYQDWKKLQALPIITRDEEDSLVLMRSNLFNHRQAGAIMRDPQTEIAWFWNEPSSGIYCKGKMDILTPDATNAVVVGDLKALAKVPLQDDVWWDGKKYGYREQAAFYSCNLADMLGCEVKWVWILQEKVRPFDVVVRTIKSKDLRLGKDNYTSWLLKLSQCLSRNEWPGMSDEIEFQEFPKNFGLYDDNEL